VAALEAEISHFADPDYFTDEQMDYAKNQLEIGEIQGQEKPSQFVHTVSYWWTTGGLDYYLHYLDNLRAVNREDIKNYLNRYVLESTTSRGTWRRLTTLRRSVFREACK